MFWAAISSPWTAEILYGMSWIFCSRRLAVTTISSSIPALSPFDCACTAGATVPARMPLIAATSGFLMKFVLVFMLLISPCSTSKIAVKLSCRSVLPWVQILAQDGPRSTTSRDHRPSSRVGIRNSPSARRASASCPFSYCGNRNWLSRKLLRGWPRFCQPCRLTSCK